MITTHPGDGTVAMYRWFENGEGWAFHPWFGARGLDLSRALDAILKRGEAGTFCVPALGGYLVGEQCDDDFCPDRKARDRRPTILRAAFFARRPAEAARGLAIDALRHLPLPTQRREDPQLALDAGLCADLVFDVDEHAGVVSHSSAGFASAAQTSASRRRLILYLGLGVWAIMILVGAFAARQWFASQDAHPPVSESIRPPRPVSPASAVEEEPGLRLDMLTAGRFRDVLGAYAPVDHPYTAYLKAQSQRLPESANVYQDRKQLRQLLPDLLREASADAELASDDALADAIAAEINYERWRAGPGKRAYRDRDKPLPEELRRFVERFRRPAAALRNTAGAMAELLQAWGEREPSLSYAGQHPLTAIDRFFAFLTRPRFAPRPLTLDHPKAAFLWRLPADPIGEDMTFDTEADLSRSLRQLLYHLDPRFNPREETASSIELLRRIGMAMRYDAWRRGDGQRTYVDEAKEPGYEIDAFVARFAAKGERR